MTVFVDDMKMPFGRMLMSHMAGDTEEELHAMARVIGVARRFYQGDHYDVCQSKRALAVQAGAIEITAREAVPIRNLLRDKCKKTTPSAD